MSYYCVDCVVLFYGLRLDGIFPINFIRHNFLPHFDPVARNSLLRGGINWAKKLPPKKLKTILPTILRA